MANVEWLAPYVQPTSIILSDAPLPDVQGNKAHGGLAEVMLMMPGVRALGPMPDKDMQALVERSGVHPVELAWMVTTICSLAGAPGRTTACDPSARRKDP